MLKTKKKNELVEIGRERKQEESTPSPGRHGKRPSHILVKQLRQSCSRFLASSLSPSPPSTCSYNTSSPRISSPCHIRTPSTAFSRTRFTMQRSSSSPSSSKTSMLISRSANINAYKDDSVAECIQFMKKSACPTT